MFSHSLTTTALHDCLQRLKPVELLGMQLLQTHMSTALPMTGVARDSVVAAVTELMDYSERCAATLQQLTRLQAVPLQGIMTLEFGL